jgi:acyl dehydratase
MPRYFFEDFPTGWTGTFGPITITKDEIITFARAFDPQVFHTDEEGAKNTFVGRLIASGWHTCSLTMKLMAEGFILDTASMGAPGVEETKWMRPVLPGDTLTSHVRVLDARASKSRPEMGLVHYLTEIRNGRGETVMSQSNWSMLGRRGYPWPPGPGAMPDRSASPIAPPPPTRVDERAIASPFLEDLEVGDTLELGSVTFTPDAIIRFAKQYDPQVFHVNPDAARLSSFGDLCASGWHTGSTWMRLMVDYRQRSLAEARRRGEPAADLGPSPGFKYLRWPRPVYAGDTISYRASLTAARPSATRPGWGIAFHRNSGTNQYGEEVFSFEGSALWQRRT